MTGALEENPKAIIKVHYVQLKYTVTCTSQIRLTYNWGKNALLPFEILIRTDFLHV